MPDHALRGHMPRPLLSVLLACACCLASCAGVARGTTQVATPIALYEAEILVYLLPQAQEVRRQGWEIGWELQRGREAGGADFFVFHVYNATRPSSGSVTIGYFAVNRQTAEVWECGVPPRIVSSREMRGVQKILRQGHRIDDRYIKEHGTELPPGACP